MTSFTRTRLLTSSILLGSALVAAPAFAQEAPVVTEEADEVIVVTGSRIARPDIEASSPVAVVNSQSIERSGQTNVAEILRRQPIFATGVSPNNTNFSTAGNGLNLLDLRGLGTARTLVLLNGRRVVAGSGGTSAVDINMIPTDVLERVEVLTGGASAVYGSDAVAGVVNFVLKDDFEGVELRAQSGISSRGDSPKYRLSGTVGTNFADGRGNIWLNGTYDRDEGLLSANREFSSRDVFGRSSFAPQGSFGLNGTIFDITDADPVLGGIYGNDYTFDQEGNLQVGFAQNRDGFNRNGFRRLTVPVERYLASAGGHFDITDNVTFYAEASYGKTKSSASLEPYPAAGGDPATDGAGSIDVIGGIAIDNAFIPGPIAAAIAARNSDGDTTNDVGFIAFRRRLTDVFNRSNRNERDFYRAAVGLRGDIDDRWNWDVSYVYGKTTDFTTSETVYTDRFTNALDAVVIGGEVVCRSAAARAEGCRPLNIFGANTADPDAVNYVRDGGTAVNSLSTKIEQHVASASLTGKLFTLPGGDVQVAIGGEYRKESSSDDWDENTNAGNTLGNFLTDTRGEFDVWDAYGELVVPLVSEAPFAHYLGVEGAARYDHYSTIGGVFSWKGTGIWAPTPDIRFRATYAQANRAPNIGELFSAQSETFPGTLTLDPCNGVTAARNNEFDAACRAIPGVAAAIAANGVFEYNTVEIQSINGFDGGNPNLQEETAKTWTVGAVFTPTFLRNFSLSVDWYRIDIKGAVNSAPREETVKACLSGSPACGGLVQRLATGKITRIDAFNINTGGFRTSGIDVVANYNTKLSDWGGLAFQLNYTRLLEHKRQPFTGAAYIDELGQLQDANGERLGSGFKDRFTLQTDLSMGPVTLSYVGRYFGGIKDTKDPANAPEDEVNNISSFMYHDFQVRFGFGEEKKREFYIGVDNAFDKQPPALPNGATASGQIGAETAQEYDVLGRYFYAGFRVAL